MTVVLLSQLDDPKLQIQLINDDQSCYGAEILQQMSSDPVNKLPAVCKSNLSGIEQDVQRDRGNPFKLRKGCFGSVVRPGMIPASNGHYGP